MPKAVSSELARRQVLGASQQYYAHRAYYLDLLSERRPLDKDTRRELFFLEFAFRKKATRGVSRVLDVACGGGRHIVGLAQKGYQCTGRDFTPERVEMTRKRAARFKVSVDVDQGDATKLDYANEFDAVLGLNVLFLLPSDEDVKKCIVGAYRTLRPGGVLVCNILNALAAGKSDARRYTNNDHIVNESRGQLGHTSYLVATSCNSDARMTSEPEEIRFRSRSFIVVKVPKSSLVHNDHQKKFPIRLGTMTHHLDALGLVNLLQEIRQHLQREK